jgi:hypothetical protein
MLNLSRFKYQPDKLVHYKQDHAISLKFPPRKKKVETKNISHVRTFIRN